MKNMWNRSILLDPNAGGEGGGGGGEGGGGDDLQAQIAAAVETATAGLRENKDAILAEKRQLAEQSKQQQALIEGLGGEEGIKKLQEFQAKLESDEVTRLLAEGKHDEWLDQRTQSMRNEYDGRISDLTTQLEEATAQRAAAVNKLNQSMLTMAADTAGAELDVVNSAMSDVRLNVLNTFSFDEKLNQHVIKDENGVIAVGKDGKSPKTVAEWLEERKKTHPHWFPASQGAGNGGGMGGEAGEPNMENISNMSMAQYRQLRKDKGMGSGYAGNVRPL